MLILSEGLFSYSFKSTTFVPNMDLCYKQQSYGKKISRIFFDNAKQLILPQLDNMHASTA